MRIQERALRRSADRIRELLDRNPDDPKWWSDADKLRLLALTLEKRDFEKGIYDHNEVQIDLRRIANRLEELDA